jgi:hypothetical protein
MGQQFSAGARLPRHVYPTSPALASTALVTTSSPTVEYSAMCFSRAVLCLKPVFIIALTNCFYAFATAHTVISLPTKLHSNISSLQKARNSLPSQWLHPISSNANTCIYENIVWNLASNHGSGCPSVVAPVLALLGSAIQKN